MMEQQTIADEGIKIDKQDLAQIVQAFQERFKSEVPRVFYAPGRVNLIGEHTDYNEGFVLPIAIEYGTVVAGVSRSDRIVRVHSVNEDETVEFDLDAVEPYPKGQWINYVEGVCRSLGNKGFTLKGADFLIAGNVPVGAGLSSSAALENAVAYAALSLSEIEKIDRVQMALAGQAAEHHYVGTQCGIMDQLITALGQQNHALLIDCRSLETQPVPIKLSDMKVVICDSRVKHALSSSAYNQRVAECKRGVEFFRSVLPEIRSLRDIDEPFFLAHQNLITDEIVLKRVRHVVTENARTLKAAEALKNGNAEQLGQLMLASHQSLKSDYEVSCPELDLLVEIAQSIPGVAGARMTGGGFGGCTVNLVQTSALQAFTDTIISRYQEAFGQAPRIYITEASEGVQELSSHHAISTHAGNGLSEGSSNRTLSQQGLNQQLTKQFDLAFDQGHLQAFIQFANRQMPPLTSKITLETVEAKLYNDELHPGLPSMAELKWHKTRLTISREFGIRLYYQNRQLTTDIENIPKDYPWFLHDPTDPQDIAGYASRHVARGSRGESPWPESQWPQIGGVQQGEQNWPHRDAAFGPYHLDLMDDGIEKAILLSLPSQYGKTQPNAYGVIPRGIFTLPSNTSVLMALQHENHSTQGLHWSPWFVLGFGVPKEGTITNPSTILAFPDEDASEPIQTQMTKVWNYTQIEGRKIALINPHAKTLNEPFKKLYSDVNWSVLAFKGADFIILTRSILRHKEQFFPFLEHGRYFVEVEHTGPRVSFGQKSTVLVQHDLVSVQALSRSKLQTLSTEKGQFEADVRDILGALIIREQTGELLGSYGIKTTFS